jgi:mono/diheme cytochrome c family protein
MLDTLHLRKITSTALLLVLGTGFTVLAACGGYGSSSGGTSGGTSCGSGPYGGTTCPAPTINAQSPGASVNRSVTLTASPQAPSGATVSQVEFLIDGASVGKATTAPYSIQWDSTTVADGAHTFTATVLDSQGQSGTSAAVSITVNNNPAFTVAMSPAQIFPAPSSHATGTANLTVKLANGAASGKVVLSGVTATAVTINEGFAGNSGATLITLTANAGTPGEWDVPAGALLTSDQLTALLQGKLYAIATSAANPGGEVRGQITPANVRVVFAALAGGQEVPAVTITAAGVAAVTVDSTANTVSVHLHATGVDDATAAAVDTAAAGATGPQLTALTKDAVVAGHWSVELAAVAATDVANFKANKWYVNVTTPADPNGAIRGQVDATTTPPAPPPPAAPTLTQLTANFFGICAGCHTGTGTVLPGVMNLTSKANIYAAWVGVPSIEVSSLERVKAGDPTNSYVVQKLEGTAAVGARMPLGGPYLTQAQIDQVKAWIAAGAPNN